MPNKQTSISMTISVCLHVTLIALLLWHTTPTTITLSGSTPTLTAHVAELPQQQNQKQHYITTVTQSHQHLVTKKTSIHQHNQQTKPSPQHATQSTTHLQQRHGATNSALIQYLSTQIQAHLNYPEQAKLLDETGTTTITLQLLPSGDITATHTTTSSGYTTLDQAALQTIKQAQPFSKAKHYISTPTQVVVPVLFTLDD